MKLLKKSIGFFLAVTMALLSVAVFEKPMTAKADIRTVNTLYMLPDEKFSFVTLPLPENSRFISSESSDDSVVSGVHNSKYIGCKSKSKEGKAKLKVVCYDPSNGYKTNIFKVIVKKPRVKVTMSKAAIIPNIPYMPKAILKITNSGDYFYDSIKLKLTFRNSDGDLVQKKTVEYRNIIPNDTMWEGFYPDADFDLKNSTCEIVKYNLEDVTRYDIYHRYVDGKNSISPTMKYKNGYYDYILVKNNDKKKSVYGFVTLLWYDKDNTLIDYEKTYYELGPKKKEKITLNGSMGYYESIPEYDHFELIVDGSVVMPDKVVGHTVF